MNTYKITFTRENGTVGSDNFTAPSEAQARRDFKEVYRHGNGTITSVELVSSDAPATKRQERAALEKIRKIVDELGPDSYIATAFDGCFKDAEANIENDWALSMKDRWLTLGKRSTTQPPASSRWQTSRKAQHLGTLSKTTEPPRRT